MTTMPSAPRTELSVMSSGNSLPSLRRPVSSTPWSGVSAASGSTQAAWKRSAARRLECAAKSSSTGRPTSSLRS